MCHDEGTATVIGSHSKTPGNHYGPTRQPRPCHFSAGQADSRVSATSPDAGPYLSRLVDPCGPAPPLAGLRRLALNDWSGRCSGHFFAATHLPRPAWTC